MVWSQAASRRVPLRLHSPSRFSDAVRVALSRGSSLEWHSGAKMKWNLSLLLSGGREREIKACTLLIRSATWTRRSTPLKTSICPSANVSSCQNSQTEYYLKINKEIKTNTKTDNQTVRTRQNTWIMKRCLKENSLHNTELVKRLCVFPERLETYREERLLLFQRQKQCLSFRNWKTFNVV